MTLTIGPWLLKNLSETGNPVYPLLWSVFGGEDWNEAMDLKWKQAHSPDHHQLSDVGVKLIDVTLKSDWLSSLLYALAPLSFFVKRKRSLLLSLWLYLLWLFFSWWLLTHRIDRFWIPMLPVVSLLAGIGADWLMFGDKQKAAPRVYRYGGLLTIFLVLLFNLAFISTSLCGFNRWLMDLEKARRIAEGTNPGIQYLNQHPPHIGKVLCVGEAQVFDARFPLLYNTVFDFSLLEEWTADRFPEQSQNVSATDVSLKSAEEIRAKFQQEQVTKILVNWQEILRYRKTYGYTSYVIPARFETLQAMGILGEMEPVSLADYDSISQEDQREVQSWGKELIREMEGKRVMVLMAIYEVTDIP